MFHCSLFCSFRDCLRATQQCQYGRFSPGSPDGSFRVEFGGFLFISISPYMLTGDSKWWCFRCVCMCEQICVQERVWPVIDWRPTWRVPPPQYSLGLQHPRDPARQSGCRRCFYSVFHILYWVRFPSSISPVPASGNSAVSVSLGLSQPYLRHQSVGAYVWWTTAEQLTVLQVSRVDITHPDLEDTAWMRKAHRPLPILRAEVHHRKFSGGCGSSGGKDKGVHCPPSRKFQHSLYQARTTHHHHQGPWSWPASRWRFGTRIPPQTAKLWTLVLVPATFQSPTWCQAAAHLFINLPNFNLGACFWVFFLY